jgi:hypothetical protein
MQSRRPAPPHRDAVSSKLSPRLALARCPCRTAPPPTGRTPCSKHANGPHQGTAVCLAPCLENTSSQVLRSGRITTRSGTIGLCRVRRARLRDVLYLCAVRFFTASTHRLTTRPARTGRPRPVPSATLVLVALEASRCAAAAVWRNITVRPILRFGCEPATSSKLQTGRHFRFVRLRTFPFPSHLRRYISRHLRRHITQQEPCIVPIVSPLSCLCRCRPSLLPSPSPPPSLLPSRARRLLPSGRYPPQQRH